MTDTVRRADYFYIEVTDKPREGARVLSALREAGVNLLAFSGFPTAGGKAQLDFVPEDSAAFRSAVGGLDVNVTGPKRVFVLNGEDRVGVAAEVFGKLAAEGISITASQALQAGSSRWGMLLWVNPKDFDRAATALGA